MIRSETRNVVLEVRKERRRNVVYDRRTGCEFVNFGSAMLFQRSNASALDLSAKPPIVILKWEIDAWELIKDESAKYPVLLGEFKGRDWWVFQDDFFSSNEDLKPDEVMALVLEKANKKKRKVDRAKTVAAMADGLDEAGKRKKVPREVRLFVMQRDGGKCVECGSDKNLEFDHIIPHSMGGSNTERNLQILCADCNREKGASL